MVRYLPAEAFSLRQTTIESLAAQQPDRPRLVRRDRTDTPVSVASPYLEQRTVHTGLKAVGERRELELPDKTAVVIYVISKSSSLIDTRVDCGAASFCNYSLS